jgi:phage terminase large subunit-like protein
VTDLLGLVRSAVPVGRLTVDTNVDELADAIASGLSLDMVKTLHQLLEAENDADRFGLFDNLFPDVTTPGKRFTYWARDLYPRHMEHFAAGKIYRERCFMAANQVGKTTAGCFEDACHLTGRYRTWWQGRAFRRPIRAWVAGDTNETTRDILQKELLGDVTWSRNRKTVDGSGLIPRECIGEVTWKQGVQNLVDTIEVKHSSGGWSQLGFKSYDQGRRAFQGTKKELIHFDEEPPADVYGEALLRTATTRGIIQVTFTPLLGISEVVQSFLPKDYVPSEA